MAFHVKTQSFQGPLDLLLELIEKRKLFINDISLSSIADEYISHANTSTEISLKDTANFIFIASTLVLIKSRSLLPALSLTDEEEGDIEDLKNRLKMLQEIKRLSEHVQGHFGKNIIFPRGEIKQKQAVFAPSGDLTLDNLFLARGGVLANLPIKEITPKAALRKMISLEEVMTRLSERIAREIKLSFRNFSGSQKEKEGIIVSFLAVLELIKRGAIAASQEEEYGDIELESRQIDVPRY